MCSMIVCVLLPRFDLVVAAGSRSELLGRPVALAPEPGSVQCVGEVSAAAETFGVRAGMRLGEALARCPQLVLVPPDPAGAAEAWERALERLEGIGAVVAPERPGLVCFDSTGLRGLHGGTLEGVMAATRRVLGRSVRIGAAPTRFCAFAAAQRARVRRPEVVGGAFAETLSRHPSSGPLPPRAASVAARYLAPLPVALLLERPSTAALVEPLERLGIRTLGELAALPRAKVADRFGPPGLTAHALARGTDDSLRPRTPGERLRETLELAESASGAQLERALGMLVDRLLARRERRGRTLRAVVLSARLVEGGTWRERAVFREALSDHERMRLVLVPRLALLPAPADALTLAVERFGPPAADQRSLVEEPASVRRGRLREAVRQARAAAGPEAALRVLVVDPDSRVPERRAVLAPFE
jgi:protein ImuB